MSDRLQDIEDEENGLPPRSYILKAELEIQAVEETIEKIQLLMKEATKEWHISYKFYDIYESKSGHSALESANEPILASMTIPSAAISLPAVDYTISDSEINHLIIPPSWNDLMEQANKALNDNYLDASQFPSVMTGAIPINEK